MNASSSEASCRDSSWTGTPASKAMSPMAAGSRPLTIKAPPPSAWTVAPAATSRGATLSSCEVRNRTKEPELVFTRSSTLESAMRWPLPMTIT